MLLRPADAAELEKGWMRVDVEFGEEVDLQSYGGPNKSLIIQSREASSINLSITDRARTVPRTVTNFNGTQTTTYVNPVIPVKVNKENGVKVDNRLSEAYLIYEDRASGLKVYYYDTISGQNEHSLLIVPGRSLQAERSEPANFVQIVADLTDPAKLASLKVETRAIFSRYNKLIYWLKQAEVNGERPQLVLHDAFAFNGTDPALADLRSEMVLQSLKRASERGWLSAESLERLKSGQSAIASIRGQDQEVQVDYIVPIDAYPRYGNEIANLHLVLPSEERKPGAALSDTESWHLRRLEKLWNGAPLSREQGTASNATASATAVVKPGWSIIGGSLLYQGREITTDVDRDAARWGLNRELFIQERVWAEKERLFGAEQGDEYARLQSERLKSKSDRERANAARLREAILRSR